MTDDGSISPGVLCVQPHGPILENYQVKGFVKPPEWKTINTHLILVINELMYTRSSRHEHYGDCGDNKVPLSHLS